VAASMTRRAGRRRASLSTRASITDPALPMSAVPDAHLKCLSTDHLEGLEQLISIDDLSDYLGVPVRTIYDWRLTGHGPCAIRCGRHLKYAITDVASGWQPSARARQDGLHPGSDQWLGLARRRIGPGVHCLGRTRTLGGGTAEILSLQPVTCSMPERPHACPSLTCR
jgi:hypothetical protein